MTNKERNIIKKKILKCLTEDFKGNQAIFNKKEGWQVFYGTDLDMVMNAVIKGLEMAKYDMQNMVLNGNKTKCINCGIECKSLEYANKHCLDNLF